MMQNLMMDLLDLAQIENNTFKLNKAFFSLPEAITQSLQVVSHNAESKKLAMVGPVMSSEDEQFFQQVYGDKSRLVQVITNFLSNSIKFSNHNSKVIVELQILQKQILKSSEFDENSSSFNYKPESFLPEFGNLHNELAANNKFE